MSRDVLANTSLTMAIDCLVPFSANLAVKVQDHNQRSKKEHLSKVAFISIDVRSHGLVSPLKFLQMAIILSM